MQKISENNKSHTYCVSVSICVRVLDISMVTTFQHRAIAMLTINSMYC